jgi:hypothetical protein
VDKLYERSSEPDVSRTLSDVTAPPVIRQGQLVSIITSEIAGAIDTPWANLRYESRRVAPYGELATHVTKSSGETVLEFPPRSVSRLTRELREVMYRPGVGTWFTFTLTITPDGAADAQFDYDNEPEWDTPQIPQLYVEDMERFPRDDDHIPAWLAEKLRAGRAYDAERDAIDGPRKHWTPITGEQ